MAKKKKPKEPIVYKNWLDPPSQSGTVRIATQCVYCEIFFGNGEVVGTRSNCRRKMDAAEYVKSLRELADMIEKQAALLNLAE